ncbi:MAG: polyamine ABC transporter substrate-binding protein [Pseudomonadales bacterium]
MFRSRSLPFVAAAALAAALLTAGCGGSSSDGSGADKVVNFYNWSDYIHPDVLPEFTAETGIRVRYDVYDSNDVLEGKLLAGNTGYDIVVPTGNFFEVQRKAGLFQPIDRERLSNWDNLDPDILAKIEPLDPGNLYAVPYAWGTNGLGINLAKVRERIPDAPLDSWDLLFDPENAARLADCGITLLDAADEVNEIALNYLGFDHASSDPEELRQAMEMVGRIRPYVRYFHSSQYIDDFANGEICLVLGWSGDLYQAINDAREGLELDYVIPKEGTIVWFDLMAIPADAPNADNAHTLIDFLLRPDVAARTTNTTYFANGNRAAFPLLDESISGDPAIYPPPEVMARLFPNPVKASDYVRARNRLWTQIKTGR